jgi:predicted aspartyl protease
MFKVRVTVTNPADAARSFDEDFWVDTGALYTFVPEDRLQQIGIEPLRSRELVLADGRREQRLLGEARLTVADLGETLTCPVIFGPPGSLYLLGGQRWRISGSTPTRSLAA